MFKKFFSNLALFATLILILAGLVFLAKSNLPLYLKNKDATQTLEEKKQELEKLNKEKEAIKEKLRQLEEPAGFEKIARERFLAKKPGEQVLIISDEISPKQESPSGTATSSQLKFWWKIVNFFMRD